MEAARAFDIAPPTWSVGLYESAPAEADVVVFGTDVGAKDGIKFDPDDPKSVIDKVEAAAASARSAAALTVVTSASGGTGATSVALHLASGGDGVGACFLDFDLAFGAAARLGLHDNHLTWREAGGSAESLKLAALPVSGGFRALLSPGDGEPPDDAAALVDRTVRVFSRVVVDVPIGPLLNVALARCRSAVLVMAPDIVSAQRSRVFLADYPSTRWAVVINRTGPGGETTVRALQRIVGHPIAIELPCAPALRDAADDGKLLTSRLWRYRRAIVRLQGALEKS
jgi:Flp pilus assembly CpaE family ATPase